MRNHAWITFLRHVPPDMQDGLAVKTLGGTEVSIQSIFRVDHEFFALKGRLAGTQDAGRLFFIPYNQIDHLYYQKEVREADFNAVFDNLTMPAPEGVSPIMAETPVPARPEPVAEAVAPVEATQAPAPPPAPIAPSQKPGDATPAPLKSAVLERFRTRGSGNSPSGVAAPAKG